MMTLPFLSIGEFLSVFSIRAFGLSSILSFTPSEIEHFLRVVNVRFVSMPIKLTVGLTSADENLLGKSQEMDYMFQKSTTDRNDDCGGSLSRNRIKISPIDLSRPES
jgi:hypothetical protein